MQLHNIQRKTKRKTSRQVGRGGKRGKTSGRGTKGQNARAGRKKRPEMRDIIKKLPKLRGYFNKSIEDKNIPVSLSTIEKNYSNGDVVSVATLLEKKIIRSKGVVKILSPKKDSSFSKKLQFEKVKVSKGAKDLIEKAGGNIS